MKADDTGCGKFVVVIAISVVVVIVEELIKYIFRLIDGLLMFERIRVFSIAMRFQFGGSSGIRCVVSDPYQFL